MGRTAALQGAVLSAELCSPQVRVPTLASTFVLHPDGTAYRDYKALDPDLVSLTVLQGWAFSMSPVLTATQHAVPIQEERHFYKRSSAS